MFSHTHKTLFEYYAPISFDKIRDNTGTIDESVWRTLQLLGVHDISVAVLQPIYSSKAGCDLEISFNGFTVQHPYAKRYSIREQAIEAARKLVGYIQEGAYHLLNPKKGRMKLRLSNV